MLPTVIRRQHVCKQTLKRQANTSLYETRILHKNVRSTHSYDPQLQQHIVLWSIKHGQSEHLINPFHPVSHAPMTMQTASSLVQSASSHTPSITKTSIGRIIGRRCRCAGCHDPRPNKNNVMLRMASRGESY